VNQDPFGAPETLISRIYAYVAYRVGEGPTAEDITSDVFERALRYRHTFDGRRGDVLGWLVGIARRCIHDASHPDTLASAAEVDEPSDGIDLERQAIVRLDVRAGLARLPERDRELIALRYGADLPARRIGELMGMKTNAVEVALHRALGQLRELLSDQRMPEAEPISLEPNP